MIGQCACWNIWPKFIERLKSYQSVIAKAFAAWTAGL